jgi:Flp pilus assembly secretin CpaC
MIKKMPRSMKLVLAAAVALASLASAAASSASFRVPIDQARPLTLRAPAAGIVIGNPSIAGVSLQSSKLLFITGRSYGTTNLIIVGANGRPVYESLITVTSAESPITVMVTRGLTTVRNECAPRCRATPDIGDDSTAFDLANKQASQHAGQAHEGQ